MREIAKVSRFASPAAKAKVLIVACLKSSEEFVDTNGTRWGALDLAACCENMLLEATALGLGGVWLGVYPDKGRVSRISCYLGCEDDLVPFAVLAFGWPATAQKKKRESTLRKKLETHVVYFNRESEVSYAEKT